MNPLEYIDKFTANIKESAIALKCLSMKSQPLPSIENISALIDRLMAIQPKDVINQLVYTDYAKKRLIVDSLKGYLDVDSFIGIEMIDDVQYDY